MIALMQKYMFVLGAHVLAYVCVYMVTISQCHLYVLHMCPFFFLSTISMEVVYKVNERTHFLFNVYPALFTHLTHITLVFKVIFISVT